MTEKEIISKHFSKMGKKSQENRTPEQRKAMAKKGWETRRAKKASSNK